MGHFVAILQDPQIDWTPCEALMGVSPPSLAGKACETDYEQKLGYVLKTYRHWKLFFS